MRSGTTIELSESWSCRPYGLYPDDLKVKVIFFHLAMSEASPFKLASNLAINVTGLCHSLNISIFLFALTGIILEISQTFSEKVHCKKILTSYPWLEEYVQGHLLAYF